MRKKCSQAIAQTTFAKVAARVAVGAVAGVAVGGRFHGERARTVFGGSEEG